MTMDFTRLLTKAAADPGAYAGAKDGRTMGAWTAQAVKAAILIHAGADALAAIEAAYQAGRSSAERQPARGPHGYLAEADPDGGGWVLTRHGTEVARTGTAFEISSEAARIAIECYPSLEPAIMTDVAAQMGSSLEQVIFKPDYRLLLGEALSKDIFAKGAA